MPAKYHGDKCSETLLKGSSDMASLSLRSLLTLFLAFGFTPVALGAGSSSDSGSSGYSYTAEPSESDDMRASKAAIERKDFEAALISLKRERSANPQNADAWNLTGFSLRKIGQYDGSEKAYIRPSHWTQNTLKQWNIWESYTLPLDSLKKRMPC